MIATRRRPIANRLLKDVKYRCKRDGLLCELKLKDIIIPDFCPVFGTKIQESGPYGPSVDRVNNDIRDYLLSNSVVICNRANRIKADGTAMEHLLIALYMMREEQRHAKQNSAYRI